MAKRLKQIITKNFRTHNDGSWSEHARYYPLFSVSSRTDDKEDLIVYDLVNDEALDANGVGEFGRDFEYIEEVIEELEEHDTDQAREYIKILKAAVKRSEKQKEDWVDFLLS